MNPIIQQIENSYKKPKTIEIKSGDTIRISEKITEGSKTRTQTFEGLVIRVKNKNSLNYSVLIRKVTSGIGVEKQYLIHSPTVEKVEVVKRSKVRRNYLSYMRHRSGKSARLTAVEFDRDQVNNVDIPEAKASEATKLDTSKTADEEANQTDSAPIEATKSPKQTEKQPKEEAKEVAKKPASAENQAKETATTEDKAKDKS